MVHQFARLLTLAAVAVSSAAAATTPALHFRVFAHTGIKLTDVVWTGARFLYVENTTNAIFVGDAKGGAPRPFASLPKLSEETRCVVSSGGYGFPAGQIYCHVPDNRIYRVSADGTSAKLLASLPTRVKSDGMLAFDTVGRFGRRLVAATGRSGHATSGGAVFTVDSAGRVRRVGRYRGPGGADEVAVAPAGFGRVAGWALLTVDAGKGRGAVVAVGPKGQTRTVATLPDGPNPIVAIPRSRIPSASAGLYVADTTTGNVYFAPAAQFAPYAGDVLVGTELGARFFVIQPHGNGYDVRELRSDLPEGKHNLEGADYVGASR